jgi:hypothetical protein
VRRTIASRPGATGVLLLVLTVAVASAVSPARAQELALQVVPVTTQLWAGDNDLILELFDGESVPIVDPDAHVTVTLVAPDGTPQAPVTPELRRFVSSGRDLYVTRLPFDQPGPWRADVTVEGATGTVAGQADLTVRPDDGTPALGSEVPDVATPTMRDVLNLVRSLSSDPDPIPEFYTWSVSELLAARQPFVLVFDSYVFRPNEACGGVLGMVHEIYTEFPRLSVVHAEPWATSYETGTLTLDPPDGPAQLTAAAAAYGLGEPPWVFVVDREGRLHAKFEGVVGTDELRAAMAAVNAA